MKLCDVPARTDDNELGNDDDRGGGGDGSGIQTHRLTIAPDIILFDIYSSRNDNTSRHVKKNNNEWFNGPKASKSKQNTKKKAG